MIRTELPLGSLLLTTLMVASVVAGTAAFSGAAAAQQTATDVGIDSAVEADGYVEVVLNKSVEPITLYIQLDGETVVEYDGGGYGSAITDTDNIPVSGNPPFSEVNVSQGYNSNQRYHVRLEDGSGNLVDVDPNRELDITLTYDTDVDESDGSPVTENVSADVTLTSDVVEEGDGNADRDSAPSLYRGGHIAVRSDSTGDEVFVENDDESALVIDGNTGTNSRILTVDTREQEVGADYEVNFDGETDDDDTEWFALRDVRLNATPEDASVDDETDVEVDVSAARGGEPFTAELRDADGEEVATRTDTLNAQGTGSVTFGAAETVAEDGPYTVAVTDNRTNVTATTEEIEVTEARDPSVSLNRSVYREQRGDVVTLGLSLTNADTATVTLGSAEDVGWSLNVTVEDRNDDDFVVLWFNTYTAGAGDNGYLVVDVTSDELPITNVGVPGGSWYLDTDAPEEKTLTATSYPIRAVVGDAPAAALGEANSTGQLSLSNRTTDDIETYVVPGPRADDIDSASDVRRLRADGAITSGTEVSTEDALVTEIRASGLAGVLRNHTDAAGLNTTEGFLAESGESEGAWTFRLNETDLGPNVDPYSGTLNATNTRVHADRTNDTYWLVIDADQVPEFRTGDALVANFTAYERDDLTHESASVTTTLEYVAAEASVTGEDDVDGDGDREVTVRNSTEQEIAGQTSLAPGREVTVRLSGSDPGAPVTELLQTRVRSDGVWNVSADFSDIPAGTNFTVDVLLGSESLLDSPVDARVVARAEAETDDRTTDRATDTDQEPTTDEPTDADPATASEPTETDTTAPTSDTETPGTTAATANAETPGLGVIHAIVALLVGGFLVAFRRRG